MSGLADLSDAELSIMLQQKLDEAKAMPAGNVPEPAPKGILQNLGAGFMGAVRPAAKAAGAVLALPERAGSYVGDKTMDATNSPELAFGANVLTQAVPGLVGSALNLGGRMVKAPAEWLMKNAMKPSLADLESPGKVPRAVTTMLNKGSNPLLPGSNVTEGGVEFLRGAGNQAVGRAQSVLGGSNADISGADVLRQGMDRPIREIMNYGDPQQALGQAGKVAENFANHPAIGDINSIPIQQAQKLKQGFYKQAEDSFGTPDIAGTNMARKGLAHALRMEIEKAEPGVIAPNAEASDIFNALNVIKRRALTAGNVNPGGIAPLFGHDPIGALAYLTLRSPIAKSQLARALNASQGGVGMAAGGMGPAMAALLQGKEQQ